MQPWKETGQVMYTTKIRYVGNSFNLSYKRCLKITARSFWKERLIFSA